MVKAMRLAAFAFLLLASATAAADKFDYEGDSSSIDKARNRTILVGNASIRSDDTLIKADRIELFGKNNRYALCSGRVTFVDSKKGISISTEKLEYDRTAKRSRMQGPTVMEDKKNKVVIKGSFIEDDGENEITMIQINVRIIKENMICRSEYAYYRRKDKILELSGLPVVVKDGSEHRAARITVDLDKDDISMEGGVSGSIKDESTPGPSPSPSATDKPEASPSGGRPPEAAPAPSPAPQPTAGSPAP